MIQVTSNDNAAGVDDVFAEHRRIRELTTLVRATSDLAGLLNRLAELRALLERHFVSEEAPDGFFEAMRLVAPRNIGPIGRLRREHAGFLADMDGLVAKAKSCLQKKGEVLREARELTSRLWDHEGREDSLLIDTMYTDLGQGD
jgi:hypothetical protein